MSGKYDIAVLGGGPGGYVAAIRAAQLGFKTVVIDKDNLGGICLNWGCIPTKSLLKNAEVYDMMKNHSGDFGISVEGLNFDFSKIIKRSRNVATKMSRGVDFLMKKNKVDVVKGFGKFISPKQLDILDSEGTKIDTINADKVIIATGARPKKIDAIPVDNKNIITSKEAMNLEALPKDLIVIGAGAIGVEFAYFYSVLGTKVTIIEMMDSLVPIEDKESSKVLETSFKKRGIEVYTSTKVESAVVKGKSVVVTIEKNGEKKELKAEKVLNAIGVTGNVEGFGLEEIGVELYKNHIKVDKENYKTNVDGVYAIGDVIGPPWLAHVASAEGITCVEKIKGLHVPSVDYSSIPGCTYCQPQIASIG
ncbi:MAG: dihydrolipoyl dehydrogenase, partial [Melioribacteraceae bacterium]